VVGVDVVYAVGGVKGLLGAYHHEMGEPPLLRVEWVDASLLDSGWQEAQDMTGADVPNVDVGFRVKEEGGILYLAAGFQAEDTHKPFSRPIAIPIRSIVKKRRVH